MVAADPGEVPNLEVVVVPNLRALVVPNLEEAVEPNPVGLVVHSDTGSGLDSDHNHIAVAGIAAVHHIDPVLVALHSCLSHNPDFEVGRIGSADRTAGGYGICPLLRRSCTMVPGYTAADVDIQVDYAVDMAQDWVGYR